MGRLFLSYYEKKKWKMNNRLNVLNSNLLQFKNRSLPNELAFDQFTAVCFLFVFRHLKDHVTLAVVFLR